MNVLLLYPEFPDTFWSFKHALKFVHKRASLPPLGLLTVAAMLPAGWSVASRSGAVVTAAGTVRLGIADAPLERRAEVDAVCRHLELAEAERVDADGQLARTHAAAEAGRAADAQARRAEPPVNPVPAGCSAIPAPPERPAIPGPLARPAPPALTARRAPPATLVRPATRAVPAVPALPAITAQDNW